MKVRDQNSDLPRDVEALLRLVRDQQLALSERDESLASRDQTLASRDQEIVNLKHNLAVFARMLYGQKSERKLTGLASGHEHQLHLFFADLVADAERIAEETGVTGHVEVEKPDPAKQVKKKGRRKKFPKHLPVVTTLFELSEDQLTCRCGGALHPIGFEESRELERIEVTIVHKKKRAKYCCRSCEAGVVTAPGSPRVIDKGLLGPGFLAHVIAERFQFHMPYYRLEKKYAGEGLDLSRSVLERSVSRCGELLEPLHHALQKSILTKDIVFTDDTTVKIAQAGKPGSSKTGRLWVYIDKLGQHFYDFTESREPDRPIQLFEHFRGFIHADAYPGYDKIFRPDDVTEVACWAHTRRYFERAESSDPELSAVALGLIRKLYRVEKIAREKQLDDDGLLQLRQRHSVEILEQIKAWLGSAEATVLPKSPMGKAVHYAQAQWEALVVYATDGRLEIDNNRAERAMKPVAVGRKNWLFVQTLAGGKTAAVMMSLIHSAEAAGINVKLYLRDVLQRIATETDVTKLLPHAWKENFESEVEGRRNEIVEMLVADQHRA